HPSWKLFVVPLSLPPRILLLGAGPDAVPVVDFAARLDWKVTLVDHRPAYAVASHFPAAERVILARPDALPAALDLSRFAAAVVMSHHLPSDLAYLRALAATGIDYVGLLGPAARREKLLSDLGTAARGWFSSGRPASPTSCGTSPGSRSATSASPRCGMRGCRAGTARGVRSTRRSRGPAAAVRRSRGSKRRSRSRSPLRRRAGRTRAGRSSCSSSTPCGARAATRSRRCSRGTRTSATGGSSAASTPTRS